jgi:hypothetical protein
VVILFVIGDLIAEPVVSEDTSFSGERLHRRRDPYMLLIIARSWVSFQFL